MRRILAIAAMSCVLAAGAVTVADVPAAADAGIESELVGMLNAHRGANGLPPLQVSGELVAKARGWSAQMAANGGISHSNLSSGISTPWLRLGENVGVTSASPGAAGRIHNAWVNSGSHNANLLDPGFRLVGVGVFVDTNGRVYATQVFMEPASQPAPSSPAPATGTPSSPGPAPAPAPAAEPAPPPPPPPPPPPAQLTMTLDRLRHLEAG